MDDVLWGGRGGGLGHTWAGKLALYTDRLGQTDR